MTQTTTSQSYTYRFNGACIDFYNGRGRCVGFIPYSAMKTYVRLDECSFSELFIFDREVPDDFDALNVAVSIAHDECIDRGLISE